MTAKTPVARGRVEQIVFSGVVTRAGRPDETIVFGEYQAGFFGWVRRKLQALMKGLAR
jgi:hypothetical protein